METELRGLMLREGELYSLYGLMQLVAKVLVDDGDESFNLFRLQGAGPSTFKNLAHVVGPEEGQIVPTLEVAVDPGRNSRKKLVEGACFGVGSQYRRHQLANDARVESVAGERNTAVAEQLPFFMSVFAGLGSDAQ